VLINGLLQVSAVYTPLVFLVISLSMGGAVFDVFGILAGHVYYFLTDVYPRQTGRRPLKTPWVLRQVLCLVGVGGG